MPKIKVIGQTVHTGERPQTNGRTHTHTDATKRIIAPATWSIINKLCVILYRFRVIEL